MLLLSLTCLLLGAVLGLRFKILALVPAIAIALPAAIAFAHTSSFAHLLAALAVTTSLQIGYLCGLGMRHFTVVSRTPKVHAASVEVSPSQRNAAT